MEKNAEANKGGGLSPEESAAPIWSRENSLAALANIVCAAQEAMVQTAESKNGEPAKKVFNTQAAQVATRALSEINRMLGIKEPEEQQGITVELDGELDELSG